MSVKSKKRKLEREGEKSLPTVQEVKTKIEGLQLIPYRGKRFVILEEHVKHANGDEVINQSFVAATDRIIPWFLSQKEMVDDKPVYKKVDHMVIGFTYVIDCSELDQEDCTPETVEKFSKMYDEVKEAMIYFSMSSRIKRANKRNQN